MSNKLTKNIVAIERGQRLKFLRSSIAGMTGTKFSSCCGFARGTLSNWETGKGKWGLTEKGGNQIIKTMQTFGIHCDLAWLLDGVGSIPQIKDQHKLARLHYPSIQSKSSNYVAESSVFQHNDFLEEVDLFKTKCSSHLLYTFADESMTPIYYPDDCVGGPRLNPHSLSIAQSSICIVLLQPGKLFVRRVRFEDDTHEFMSFYGINAEAALEHPPVFRVPTNSVIAIAPVTRLWRNIKNF